MSSRWTERVPPVRRCHESSGRSSHANVSSAKQRSSVSSISSTSSGAVTGESSSTRVSRLRGMRSAEPIQ